MAVTDWCREGWRLAQGRREREKGRAERERLFANDRALRAQVCTRADCQSSSEQGSAVVSDMTLAKDGVQRNSRTRAEERLAVALSAARSPATSPPEPSVLPCSLWRVVRVVVGARTRSALVHAALTPWRALLLVFWR